MNGRAQKLGSIALSRRRSEISLGRELARCADAAAEEVRARAAPTRGEASAIQEHLHERGEEERLVIRQFQIFYDIESAAREPSEGGGPPPSEPVRRQQAAVYFGHDNIDA